MGKFIDLTGKKFGRLIVIRRATPEEQNKRNGTYWLCECSCDKHTLKIIRGSDLKNGKIVSCGCYKNELSKQRINEYNSKYNEYNLDNDYGIGKYSNCDDYFYFDLEDYDLIKNFCWYKHHEYAICAREINGKRIIFYMHRIVTKTQDAIDRSKCLIDHINHNKSDNRKINLRIVTCSENGMNQKIASNNTSGATGVSYDKKPGKWRARLRINYGNETYCEFYDTFEDAVKARRRMEEEYQKEYSYYNSMKNAKNYEIGLAE